MDMSQFSSGVFQKPEHVEGGPLRVWIAFITPGKKYNKPDLTFTNGDKLSLNATNNRVLLQAYGPNSADWLDKEIELYHGKLFNPEKGEELPAVLVKPISVLSRDEWTPLDPKDVAVRPIANGGGADMDDELPEYLQGR
jgi:hypothetical protein